MPEDENEGKKFTVSTVLAFISVNRIECEMLHSVLFIDSLFHVPSKRKRFPTRL